MQSLLSIKTIKIRIFISLGHLEILVETKLFLLLRINTEHMLTPTYSSSRVQFQEFTIRMLHHRFDLGKVGQGKKVKNAKRTCIGCFIMGLGYWGCKALDDVLDKSSKEISMPGQIYRQFCLDEETAIKTRLVAAEIESFMINLPTMSGQLIR